MTTILFRSQRFRVCPRRRLVEFGKIQSGDVITYTFAARLALCVGNPPVTSADLDGFFVVSLNWSTVTTFSFSVDWRMKSLPWATGIQMPLKARINSIIFNRCLQLFQIYVWMCFREHEERHKVITLMILYESRMMNHNLLEFITRMTTCHKLTNTL